MSVAALVAAVVLSFLKLKPDQTESDVVTTTPPAELDGAAATLR